jgi:hypothetical protein
MLQEYTRSPQFVLGIAAEVFALKESSIIRITAIEVIWFNKWFMFFDQSQSEKRLALQHPNSAIREGFKKYALTWHSINNVMDLITDKFIFLHFMADGINYHELGHHEAYADMNPIHKAFKNNYFDNDDNAGMVLGEALADWAPRKGAFSRFCEIAETDEIRATGLVYVYHSDNWFVDEEEEFFPQMSDVLDGLAIYFIKNDSSVDFKRIREENKTIYAFLLKRFTNLNDKLLTIIQTSLYKVETVLLDYAALKNLLFEMYQDSPNAKPYEELELSSFYWENVISYLEKYSKDGYEKCKNIMIEEKKQLEQAILKEVLKSNAKTLREYIINRAIEIGIIEKPITAKTSAFRKICKSAIVFISQSLWRR